MIFKTVIFAKDQKSNYSMRILKLFITILLLISIQFSFAKKVELSDAQKAAVNWKNSISLTKKGTATVEKQTASFYDGVNTFYIFNFEGGGYVIVSADDNITPILGYSDDNNFPENITNETVKWWMDGYNKQISNVISNKIEDLQSKKEWTNVLNNTFLQKGAKSIGPLLTTNWGQGCYYNTKCPVDYNSPSGYCSHVPTGCVATAMAQIMKYNSYPAKGIGSHTDTDKTYGTLSANFGTTTYNWSNMTAPSVTTENADVATLMYHCGVAVNMMYSADGSGAYVDDAAYALKNYFGYTNATYLQRSSYTASSWDAIIKSNIDQLSPVFYSGIDVNISSGHAFVCDGYDNSGYYHFNWGWNGSANGYYALSALKPSGSGYDFSSSQMVIVNIKPPVVAPVADFTASAISIAAGSSVNFTDNSTNTPTSWQWVFTGATPSSSSVKNPQNITYSTVGTYSVSLTAKNANGSNVKTKTNYINVYTPGSIPLTASLGNDTIICSGNSLTLTPKVAGGTPAYSYKWNTGSTASSITVNPTTTTTYTVTVTDSKSKTSIDSKIISKGSSPVISQQPVSKSVCAGSTATFSVVASGTYLSYSWKYSSDGTNFISITTAFSPNYSFVANVSQTTYKYKCVINSSCNQPISSNTVTLTVNALPAISVQPYSISTCGVKPAQFTIVATGANISYQWYQNGAKIVNNSTYTNATAATLKISNVTGLDSKKYNCTISGSCAPAATSSTVLLNVTSVCNQCDTLNYPLTGTQTTYGTTNGYLTGSNNYGIVDFAQYFPTYPSNKVITAVRIAFVDPDGNDNDLATITIRDNKGTGGIPGNILGTATVTMGIIKQYISNNKYTWINFTTPVPISTPFFVCAKIPPASTDNLAILSNRVGENSSANGWAYYGSWGQLNKIYTTLTTNIDLAISPVLCDKCEALTAIITPSGATSFCEGGSVALTANAGSFTYKWKKDGSIIGGATASIYNASSTGSYAVEIKDAGNCVAASTAIDITVFPKAVVNLGNDQTITTLQSVTLDAGAGFASYIWSNSALTQKITLNGSILGPGDFQYSVYVKDAHNCRGTDTVNIKVVSKLCSLNGKVVYDNFSKTPLKDIKLSLFKLDGTKVDSAVTDVSGLYSFSNIYPGNYKIVNNTSKVWGGGDPTDAYFINRYFVKLFKFTDMFLAKAADVNIDNVITPTDALVINKRFVKLIDAFKCSDWIFENDTIIIQNDNTTYNYMAVCTGDLNGSYNPLSKILNNFTLIDKGEINFIQGLKFDIPVYLNDNIDLGAFGLRIKYNSKYIKILDLKSEADGIIFNITNDEINIAWSALDKTFKNKSETALFTLKAIIYNGKQKSIADAFTIETESVMADAGGNSIKSAEFTVPHVVSNDDFISKNNVLIYPNPLNSSTNISYNLSADSKVRIGLYDILGKEVEIIANGQQKTGVHSIELDASAYSQGLYYCKFEIDNANVQVYKMIISR